MLKRTEGIVIRSTDYGEGHKIVTLYTREAGKISLMARGAKKAKSRHTAVTQLFTYGEFVFFQGSGMGTLNQGDLIESHHALREDLHKAAYSSYLVEMVDRLVPDQEPNGMLFEQLKAGLSAIEEDKDADIVIHIMEMKMLALAGYLPQLDECVSCGSDEGQMALSVMQGGVLCPRCRLKDPGALVLAPGTLKLLRLFQRMDLRRIGSVEVKAETKAQLKAAMRSFMDVHMGVKWKSRSFLEQMEKYNF
ncbi:DNA repair protein RecO [Paenibacillus aurantius]|uniref:DNA repair protein RecO n=1 Tax=Paenibacillus aurantius TaxID=2918900 RepID=A0AA96RGW1_9BACL|nr:DNA repair protein RecO [Paenibacillus aurantius]WNQ13467.1 DNA repair protein RecO [Paenibacillus aurantius]